MATKRNLNSITKIVAHHSAVDQPDINKAISSFSRTHKARFPDMGESLNHWIAYHYLIGVDGEYKQTRSLFDVGYHASNRPVNKASIGICFSGNFDSKEPTPEQYKTGRYLISKLRKELGPLTVHTHHEYAPSKSCPGHSFKMYKLLMNFYEQLRNDNYKDLDNKMFQDPEAAVDRLEDMSDDERLRETIFLLACLMEKVGLQK